MFGRSGSESAALIEPGAWLQEKTGRKRKLQVFAVHHRAGEPVPNVELLVDGSLKDRVSLSLLAVKDNSRFGVL